MSDEDGAWFRQKTFGYGAGLPIAWQGWAVLIAYIAVAALAGYLWETGDEVYSAAGAVLFFVATLGLVLIARAKTRGGWRWRSGKD